jgi:hypothetical protein
MMKIEFKIANIMKYDDKYDTRAIGGDRFEPLAVFTAEDDADSLGHRHRLAHGAGRVNPVSASVH